MELIRALGALAEPPCRGSRELAEALDLGGVPEESSYSDLFLFQLYPYASVYLGEEGMLGGEARDRIAGFWRALGFDPPAEPDHLTVMLALYARLCEAEIEGVDEAARRSWRNARKAFLWEHLLSWLPVYLAKLGEVATGPYRRWGKILAEALKAQGLELGVPELLPLHLRQAPPFADPREEGGEALLRSLLAPVRSGFILLRSDLERASRELKLGGRIGERRFVLKALLSQDATGTFRWLAGQARRASLSYRRRGLPGAGVSEFWLGRAQVSASLLETLAES